jgi:hypothetical protein
MKKLFKKIIQVERTSISEQDVVSYWQEVEDDKTNDADTDAVELDTDEWNNPWN